MFLGPPFVSAFKVLIEADFKPELANQHAVPVTIEAVPGLNGVVVRRESRLATGERTDKRQQG